MVSYSDIIREWNKAFIAYKPVTLKLDNNFVYETLLFKKKSLKTVIVYDNNGDRRPFTIIFIITNDKIEDIYIKSWLYYEDEDINGLKRYILKRRKKVKGLCEPEIWDGELYFRLLRLDTSAVYDFLSSGVKTVENMQFVYAQSIRGYVGELIMQLHQAGVCITGEGEFRGENAIFVIINDDYEYRVVVTYFMRHLLNVFVSQHGGTSYKPSRIRYYLCRGYVIVGDIVYLKVKAKYGITESIRQAVIKFKLRAKNYRGMCIKSNSNDKIGIKLHLKRILRL